MTPDMVTHEREAAFHDAWAGITRPDSVLVRESFEGPTAVENQFILELMGPLAGKQLLDIGSGLGESSVYFALQGADVTALDLSPGMIETTLNLGKRFGVGVKGVVAVAEELNVPSQSYDIVYIANAIHHVQDRTRMYEEIRRVLKPGGRFFSYDPLAYNPAINIYRKMATEVRTPDERPLTRADVKLASKYFSNFGHREFWIASLALFAKYYLKDHVHPNRDRYWKRINHETENNLRWWLPLRTADAVLTRIPGVRWLAWNVVMWGEKKTDSPPRT
ncbi:MAG TPA: class I SAM-dependent methyltransferase [Terriglobia bacterium]|nr:class I SAM-dependent methyltransferase [Terriglobia bacterium]